MKIYFIILAFFILRMILAQKKKGQQAQTEAARLKKAEERLRAQRASTLSTPLAAQRQARAAVSRTTSDDSYSTDAYAIGNNDNARGYDTEEDRNSEQPYTFSGMPEKYSSKRENQLTSSEHDAVSHFLRNTGLTDLDRSQGSREEEQNYSGNAPVRKSFVTKENFKQFIVAKEIFDKPRGLRRR